MIVSRAVKGGISVGLFISGTGSSVLFAGSAGRVDG
jgi:hypothetical protein